MTQTNKLKQLTAHALTVLMLMGTICMGLTASGIGASYADDSGGDAATKSIVYNADGKGAAISAAMIDNTSHIRFGTRLPSSSSTRQYAGGPANWRVLDSDADNTGEAGAIFMVSENSWFSAGDNPNSCYGGYVYWNTEDQTEPTTYQGSALQTWHTGFFNEVLSGVERSSVRAITKKESDDSPILFDAETNPNLTVGGSALNGDRVFPLSAEEAKAYLSPDTEWNNDVNLKDGAGRSYWLRSKVLTSFDSQPRAAVINEFGNGSSQPATKDSGFSTVRPALNIELGNVLFAAVYNTMTDTNYKGTIGKAAVADGTLGEVSGTDVTNWKLTLKDDSRKIKVDEAIENADGSISVTYSEATAEDDSDYVSAVIIDDEGAVTYYGRMAKNSAEGTVSIDGNLLQDYDTLYLFSEEYNDYDMSDYASELVKAYEKIPTPPKSIIYNSDGLGTEIAAVMKNGTSHVRFGTRNLNKAREYVGGPANWLVLDAKADNTGNAGAMFLLSDKVWGKGSPSYDSMVRFNDTNDGASSTRINYQGSDLQRWHQNFYNDNFSDIEKAAIPSISKTESDEESSWINMHDNETGTQNYAVGSVLSNDCVFPLSAQEAVKYFNLKDMDYGNTEALDASGYPYWLRNKVLRVDGKGNSINWVAAVSGKYVNRSTVNGDGYARPALNVKLDNVLFAAVYNTDGDSDYGTIGKAAGDVGSMIAVSDTEATDWKLTFKDSDRKITVNGAVRNDDGSVTVGWSDATADDDNDYVSAVVFDSENTMTYYGRLTQKSASGSATIAADVIGENDTLYLFSEEYNSYDRSDYASDLVKADIKKRAEKPVAKTGLTENGSAQIGVEAGTGYTLATSSEGCSIDSNGNAAATAKGTYIVTATLADGYIWNDASTAPLTLEFAIAEKSSGGGGGDGAATDPVQKVVDEINALPTPVTEANKAAVEQARKDYDALTDEQKKDSRLTDEIMKKLTDAEKAIAAAGDQKAADVAAKLIEAIPDKITESDVDAVKKAQEAYDKLTDAQKALVSEADKTKLENAVKEIRVYQMGEDGTALGSGASWEAAEKAILGMTSDADPAGSKLMPLKVKSIKQTSKSVKVQYTKPTGAVKYVIYGNKCGKKNKMKRLKTTTKASINFKKIAGKKVKKGTSYKFIVIALDKDNNVVSTSKVVHAVTKGSKKGNPTKLTVKSPKSLKKTLAAGKSFTIKSKVSKKKGTKIYLHVAKSYKGLRYESSNPAVAKVSKSGKVTAVSAGTAKIIVYTQNGINKTINVTVK